MCLCLCFLLAEMSFYEMIFPNEKIVQNLPRNSICRSTISGLFFSAANNTNSIYSPRISVSIAILFSIRIRMRSVKKTSAPSGLLQHIYPMLPVHTHMLCPTMQWALWFDDIEYMDDDAGWREHRRRWWWCEWWETVKAIPATTQASSYTRHTHSFTHKKI